VKLLEGLEARNLASYESLCALGLLYREQGRPAPARAALEKAAQLKPDAASPLLDLARVAYDQQDYTAALGYLAHARDLEPQNGAIHFLWGLICMQQNLLEESYRALKLAASLDPENPAYNYAVGVVTMQRQDAREAIAYLQKYCALRPRDPAGRLALGVAYFNSNDLDKARELLAQVAGQPQTAAAANYYLARIAADEGDYTTAARDLQNSLKADPHYAEAYAELGHIQLKQRRYREARETLQKALDLNPESYSANLNLLDLYQKTKDPLAEAQAKRFDDVKQHRNEVAKEYLRKIEVRP
jgi:tetratricopeptide (TPR) repeat protein